MNSGYKYQISWTNRAKSELEAVRDYLTQNWSENHQRKLLMVLEKTLVSIEKNPRLYPKVQQKSGQAYPLPVHKVNIQRFNSLYYAINDETSEVIILSFFSNRQNPDNIKL